MRLARRAYPRTTQAVIAKLKLGGMSTGRTGFQVAKEFQECRRQAGWCLPPAGVIDTAATIGVGALRVTYGLAGKFR